MDLYCNAQIQFAGFLRAIYFNDNFRGDYGRIGPHGSAATTTLQTQEISSALLKKNELTLVTFIGYRLRIASFSITTCVDAYLNGNTRSPTFTYYTLQTPVPTPPDTYSVIAPTGSCPPHATRCADANWALQCQENYYRYDHVCQRLCNNTGKLYANLINECTNIRPVDRTRHYLYLENYASTTASRVKATLDIDLHSGKRLIIHQGVTTNNVWGAFNLASIVPASVISAFETKSVIVSVPQAGLLNFDQTFKMIDPANILILNTYVVHEDPKKNLMIHLFRNEPTTLAILNNEGILFDFTSLGSVYTYPSNQFAKISTYLECPSKCNIIPYFSKLVLLNKITHKYAH